MTSERITSFLQRVDQLPKGDRTALKREAGTMLLQADGRAVRAFYQCLPSQVKQWEEERYFAAACLHCLWEADAVRQPMEQVLFQLGQDAELSESMGHRLESLLDLSWDEDGYLLTKLTRLVKVVKSKNYAVDCASLLGDLLYWNGEKQNVQLKWARALYMKPEDNTSREGA